MDAIIWRRIYHNSIYSDSLSVHWALPGDLDLEGSDDACLGDVDFLCFCFDDHGSMLFFTSLTKLAPLLPMASSVAERSLPLR